MCFVLAQSGKWDEAFAQINQFYNSTTDPQTQAAMLYFEGFLHLIHGQADQAEAPLEQVVTLSADEYFTGRAKHMIGMAKLAQGHMSDAVSYYTQLAASEPNNGEWQFEVAYCSYREGNWEQARDAILAICKNYSSGVWLARAKYFLADCYVKLGDNSTAATVFGQVASGFPSDDWGILAAARTAQLQASGGVSATKLTIKADGLRPSDTINRPGGQITALSAPPLVECFKLVGGGRSE